jgi:hypothetical protein
MRHVHKTLRAAGPWRAGAALAGLAVGLACAAAALPARAQPAPAASAKEAPAVTAVDVEGTEIVVRLADGRALRSKDLVGATFDMRFDGQPATVRVVAVEPDPRDTTGSVWLHTFEQRDATGAWKNLCAAGPDGRRQGFPLRSASGGLDFTCTAGASGKCVRYGYHPWARDGQGVPLAHHHAACVHLLRADYGGDGRSWTRDGTRVNVYDAPGTHQGDEPQRPGGNAFEAGWNAEGAVCVHHVRVQDNTTLAALETNYPQLKGRTGAVCTEAFARAHGAVVFNRSVPAPN